MPRQVDNTPVARPAKRRRDAVEHGSEQGQEQNGARGSSTPQSLGSAPARMRAREYDVRRTRSPYTNNGRVPTSADPTSPPRSPGRSPPRKRPGASSRIDPVARKLAEQRRQDKEDEDKKAVAARPSDDLVSAHYNAVPQKGRDWRRTESQIKGLRSFNNWVKSAVIQKFSLPDVPSPQLLVLDIGCGKGGDLQKWQSAPQTPALYVGIDPADVSIDQARGRYDDMLRRRKHPRAPPVFEAHFFAQDAFSRSLADIPIVQQVGFDPNAGPGGNGNITGRLMRGGFDVISMMFCLHYSYETEEKARGMLKNVAGALKKGGRFLGVMPDSSVISAHVKKHLKGGSLGEDKAQTEEKSIYDDETWDPEKPSNDDDDWDPTKPTDNGTVDAAEEWDPEKPINTGSDDWDPEKPAEQGTSWDPEASLETSAQANTDGGNPPAKTPVKTPATELPPLEWGNGIYTVKFPQTRPLPADGVFRPPFGWKYFFYLEEAVDVPEYVVPWEGFRGLAEEYGLELLYRKPFPEVWEDLQDDRELRPLSERMGVRSRDGRMNVSPEEMEAASFYHAFCFYKT